MMITPAATWPRRAINHISIHIKDRRLLLSTIISLTILCASLLISYYASIYAAKKASNFVTDLVLSNIPVFNVDAAFVYGPFIMWAFVIALLLRSPRQIPFTLKSISLFILVRSIFITLTHIGPFPNHALIDQESVVRFFTSDSDLFFSAHTGLPFLMALVFWQSKGLRYLFIAVAAFFGIVVLLGHLHYTIDVAGAFFITQGIYRLSEIFFKEDRKHMDVNKTGVTA